MPQERLICGHGVPGPPVVAVERVPRRVGRGGRGVERGAVQCDTLASGLTVPVAIVFRPGSRRARERVVGRTGGHLMLREA